MEVLKEESKQAIEPQFLSQAQASAVTLRIGQMNKIEHEGIICNIGRYEINLEVNGKILTLFLINGQRIKANIEAYDNFTILLKEGGRQHLYYKHSITTINR